MPADVGTLISHHSADAWRGVVCLGRMAAAVWVMTEYWDPSGYFIPKASVPSLY